MKAFNIQRYADFTAALLEAGFSLGGGNSEGIFSVVTWNWDEDVPYETPVRWHTGEAETDPWEWRMRVLNERGDVAYGKVFFKKSGYITREWYPYFLAARRGGASFDDVYESGVLSRDVKKVYDCVAANDLIPVHELKALAGFDTHRKAAFDRALVELQMKLFITVCGNRQKMSQAGDAYGWSSNAFCTVENFWGAELTETAAKLDPAQAFEKIAARVLELNPQADEKKIKKFILG